MLEYEIKSALTYAAKKQILSLAASEDLKSQNQTDVYFDTANADLYRHGVFLRLRDSCRLEIKYNPAAGDTEHVRCIEQHFNLSSTVTEPLTEFLLQFLPRRVNDIQTVKDCFRSFGLVEFVTIAKSRQSFEFSGLVICIDTVAGLGEFVEIETDSEASAPALRALATKWGLKNIPVGYVELYLRAHNYNVYSTGRYLLPEDR